MADENLQTQYIRVAIDLYQYPGLVVRRLCHPDQEMAHSCAECRSRNERGTASRWPRGLWRFLRYS